MTKLAIGTTINLFQLDQTNIAELEHLLFTQIETTSNHKVLRTPCKLFNYTV